MNTKGRKATRKTPNDATIVRVLRQHADGCDLGEPQLVRHARCINAAADIIEKRGTVICEPDGSYTLTGDLAAGMHAYAKDLGVTPQAAFRRVFEKILRDLQSGKVNVAALMRN